MHMTFLLKNVKGIVHFGNIVISGSVIKEWVF